MENRRLSIETVGYYHRNAELETSVDLLPKTLNRNRLHFENPEKWPLPVLKIAGQVPDCAGFELRMESFLTYIDVKGWPDARKPDFVANRHLLKNIACGKDIPLEIHVFRHDDVIYLLRTTLETMYRMSYGLGFDHFFTKTSKEEVACADGIVRKAVLVATIPTRSDGDFRVVYSSQVSASDSSNTHYDFKLINGGIDSRRACNSEYYWQARFGNVPAIVFGTTRWNRPVGSGQEETPVYVSKLDVLPIHTMEKRNREVARRHPRVPMWTVSEGEKRLAEFLGLVKRNATSNGDSFVFNRLGSRVPWQITRDEEAVACFRDAIVGSVTSSDS